MEENELKNGSQKIKNIRKTLKDKKNYLPPIQVNRPNKKSQQSGRSHKKEKRQEPTHLKGFEIENLESEEEKNQDLPSQNRRVQKGRPKITK